MCESKGSNSTHSGSGIFSTPLSSKWRAGLDLEDRLEMVRFKVVRKLSIAEFRASDSWDSRGLIKPDIVTMTVLDYTYSACGPEDVNCAIDLWQGVHHL
jgi:hypothetical protein